MKKYILILLICCVVLAGCTSYYDVVAIKGGDDPIDVVRIPAGSEIHTPDDLFFIEQAGWYYSDPVCDKIQRIRVKENLDPDLWDWLAKKLGLTR